MRPVVSRHGENLKSLEKGRDGIPAAEQMRFFYFVILELARDVGVRKFAMAIRRAKLKHGG